MNLKKILLLPMLVIALLFTLVFSIKTVYAAEGTYTEFSLPPSSVLEYDEYGNAAGIKFTTSEVEGVYPAMIVVTIENIINPDFILDYNNSSFIGKIHPVDGFYSVGQESISFIAETSQVSPLAYLKLTDAYKHSILKYDVSLDDFNSTNIKIRQYLGSSDDLYTYTLSTIPKRAITLSYYATNTTYDGFLKQSGLGLVNRAADSNPGLLYSQAKILTDTGLVATTTTTDGVRFSYTGDIPYAELKVGDVLTVSQVYAMDELTSIDNDKNWTFQIEIIDTEEHQNLQIKDDFFINASHEDFVYTNSTGSFDPNSDLTLGTGGYQTALDKFNLDSFSITQNGIDATETYQTVSGSYDASATFVSIYDAAEFVTIDFTYVTVLPDLMVTLAETTTEVESDQNFNISSVIVANDTTSYNEVLTLLDSYFDFILTDDTIIIPEITFSVSPIPSTTWYNTPGEYVLTYNYNFNNYLDDFVANFNVEVYQNQAPEIIGPETYRIPNDLDGFSETDLLALFTATDDLDANETLTINVTSSELDFTVQELILGEYSITVSLTDSHGEETLKTIVIEV